MDLRELYPDLPFKVLMKLPSTDTEHIDEWCFQHFGEQGKKWDSYYADDSPFNFDQYFIFAKHEDAVLFTLTWQ